MLESSISSGAGLAGTNVQALDRELLPYQLARRRIAEVGFEPNILGSRFSPALHFDSLRICIVYEARLGFQFGIEGQCPGSRWPSSRLNGDLIDTPTYAPASGLTDFKYLSRPENPVSGSVAVQVLSFSNSHGPIFDASDLNLSNAKSETSSSG